MEKNVSYNSSNATLGPGDAIGPSVSEWYATIVFGIIIAIITISANLAATVDILKKKKLLPFHYYLINLTVVDMLTGLFAQLNMVIFNYYGNWPLGEGWCNFWIFFDVFVNAVSFVTLVVISGDRLFAVAFPLKYQQNSSKKKAVVMIALSWLVVAIPFLINFVKFRMLVRHPEPQCSYIDYGFVTGPGLGSTIIAIYLPPVLITFNYFVLCGLMLKRLAKKRVVAPTEKIALKPICTISGAQQDKAQAPHKVQPAQPQKLKHDRDRKPFILLGYLILFFYLTCVPMAIFTFMWTVDRNLMDTAPTTFTAVYWLQYLNSTINPFLYAMAEKNIVSTLFKKCKRMVANKTEAVTANGRSRISATAGTSHS